MRYLELTYFPRCYDIVFACLIKIYFLSIFSVLFRFAGFFLGKDIPKRTRLRNADRVSVQQEEQFVHHHSRRVNPQVSVFSQWLCLRGPKRGASTDETRTVNWHNAEVPQKQIIGLLIKEKCVIT